MSKKQKPAGYPGHGKSKIMKKLRKEWKAWGRDHQMSNEHLEAFAALVRRLPEPKYIFTPDVKAKDVAIPTPRTWHGIPYGIGKSAILLDDVKPKPVEPDMDAFITFWDGQLDDMERAANARYDRLLDAVDREGSGQMMTLICRILAVRDQLREMKKEQEQ